MLFAKYPGGVPFIAKVDIEGFEEDLFSENLDWLKEIFVLFIEPHDWLMSGRRTSRNFQRALAQHDFQILIRGENLVYIRTS